MHRAGSFWLRSYRPLAVLCLTAAVGCMSNAGVLEDDPLRGGRPLPRSETSQVTSTAPTPRGALEEVPPLPPAQGTSSLAALTNGHTGRGPDPREADQKPQMGGPRPVVTPPTTTQVRQVSDFQPQSDTFEGLQQQLTQRGVVWQQLKTGSEPGEWQFICAIPDPQNPKMHQNYEARATGPMGLAAIKAAIAEIDRNRR